MKLFIYEHITSGALRDEPLPETLAHEGDIMLRAIVQDLFIAGQTSLYTLRDQRLPSLALAGLQCIDIKDSHSFDKQWQQCLNEFDVFLLIAPETDQQLLRLQQQVINAGKLALGCSAEAIDICSDKRKTALALQSAGIDTPDTWSAQDWLCRNIQNELVWLVKPFDGAGCLETMYFETSSSTRQYLQHLPAEKRHHCIVQPFISGDAISISVYFDDVDCNVLGINRQIIRKDQQRIIFEAVEANTVAAEQFSISQAQSLCDDLQQSIPGLQGFVGIDLIVQDHQPVVIEINPRLTTAYVGLSATTQYNPADCLVKTLSKLSGKQQ